MVSPSGPIIGQSRTMTPRPASAGTPAPTPSRTPYTSKKLRQLAGLIAKPSAPDSSSGIQSPGSPLPRRTASAGRYTPGTRAVSRHVQIRRGTPTTPHTIRALQQRRAAALAVERTRRRSGRQQRETPRDTLRNLSRILAKDSNPVESSPIPEEVEPGNTKMDDDDEDLENDSELIAPRLSLPLGDDEDSFQLPLEGLSVHMDEENLTQGSIELPRRAYSEQFGRGRSRASFGSIRMSDRFAAVDELEIPESPDREDVGFAGPDLDDIEGEDEDEDEDAEGEQIDHDDDINTRDLGQTYSEESTRSESGVQSVQEPEIMDESTFAFTVPQPRELVSPSPGRSPERQAEQPTQDMEASQMEQIVVDQTLSPGRQAEQPTQDIGDSQMEQITVDQTLSPERQAEQPTQDTGDSQMEQIAEDQTLSPERSPERQAEQPTQGMQDSQMEQVTEDPQPRLESKPKPKKELKISRHGIPYPSLPVSVVKKLATTFVRSNGTRKAQLSKETLEAIMEASDWFFEQVSDDLGVYARHAGRRMINESDMITLMKRQRQINAKTTPFSLAQRYLPRELLQQIRIPPSEKPRRRRKQQLEDVEEVDEEE